MQPRMRLPTDSELPPSNAHTMAAAGVCAVEPPPHHALTSPPPIVCARREDAERAIRALEGYGYDNLILHVEWAAPRAER